MSLNHYILSDAEHEGGESIYIGVGHPYPLPLKVGSIGLNMDLYRNGTTLLLNLCVPNPQSREIQAFNKSLHIALYDQKDLPGGVLQFRVTTGSKKPLLLFAAPYEVAGLWHRYPEPLQNFFLSKRVTLLASMTDVGRIDRVVVAMREIKLPLSLVLRLRECWWSQICGNGDYWEQYSSLVDKTDLQALWSRSQKFFR
ncbi:MAG: hypothetical protein Q8O00_15875 [Holophaga sp.]|nr:hypothetical protein [Holophaga sp.]